jgi:hypothetical protein
MQLYLYSSHVSSWHVQEQLYFYYKTDRTLRSFRLALTVYHANTIKKNTVIPWNKQKYSLMQDAQINTRFSICKLIFAYTRSFLLQTDVPDASSQLLSVPQFSQCVECHRVTDWTTRNKQRYSICHCSHNFVVKLGVVSVNHSD